MHGNNAHKHIQKLIRSLRTLQYHMEEIEKTEVENPGATGPIQLVTRLHQDPSPINPNFTQPSIHRALRVPKTWSASSCATPPTTSSPPGYDMQYQEQLLLLPAVLGLQELHTPSPAITRMFGRSMEGITIYQTHESTKTKNKHKKSKPERHRLTIHETHEKQRSETLRAIMQLPMRLGSRPGRAKSSTIHSPRHTAHCASGQHGQRRPE